MTKLFCLTFILFISANLWAQSAPKTSVVKPESKSSRVSLKFEDELVQGAAESPDGLAIQMRKNPNFKKLIKLRENFNPEMDRSKNVFQK